MFKGLLTVDGTIDTQQFWPNGRSDADTVKVALNPNPFHFTPDPKTTKARPTNVFTGAQVLSRGKPTAAIKKGVITIRLQGIDATELHFQANLSTKGHTGKIIDNGTRFRQFFGETAAIALRGLLARAGKGVIPCRVVTTVDHPNDVFDMFGRFIGNIQVQIGGQWVDANLWLAENGWAFPTFYNSMTPTEISDVLTRTNAARQKGLGIWPHFIQHVAQLNQGMTERAVGTPPTPKADIGPVLMPKIFRRLVKFSVSQQNQIFNGDFRSYLGTQSDPVIDRQVFLKNPDQKPPGTKTPDANLESRFSPQEILLKDPGDMVFFEKPSTLLDATGKKRILKF
jgi:endonuclease YncB( thermonuclease family)